jgi:hypothetical protein
LPGPFIITIVKMAADKKPRFIFKKQFQMNKLNSIVSAIVVAPLLLLSSCQNGTGDKTTGSKDSANVAAKPDSAVIH